MQFPIETEALVVEAAGGDFEMRRIVIDELKPDEVLVEMKYSGVCHTDFLLQDGSLGGLIEFPAIAGHEGAGIVRAIGSQVKDQSLKVGDPVLLSFTACGKCEPCRERKLSKCSLFPFVNLAATRWPDGSASAKLLDGRPVGGQFFGQSSFARISAVHEKCVVKCPDPDQMSIYAPMGCGYQTGAGAVFNVLKPKPSQTIALFGVGSVGSAALMAAASLGLKQIIGVDLVNRKLTLAKSLGATHVINPSKLQMSVAEEIKTVTGGRGVDFAIDTTGIPKVIEQMLDSLAFGGTAASVGAPPKGATVTLDAGAFFSTFKNWVTITEGDSYPPEFIPRLIELHREGKFPVDKISKVYPVEEFKKAVADMEAGVVIKPIIQL
ncbi:Geraniol dehydrogenase [Madurella fahalii]|uniref:Geraniol dehydrogenase n=1 Tax=Madurella fahalii TaxID=1157608 RepID=A0ABQ0GK96_9PEZI